jgi:nitroreductase
MATMSQPVMTVAESIRSRRAIRSYAPTPVDRATVMKLLDAAVLAPTAVHEEPWVFLVIQDRALLRRLSDRAKAMATEAATGHEQALDAPARARQRRLQDLLADPEFNVFYDAGTLVVICARPVGHFVVADCWLAAENLMLLACAMGLGTCPIGFALPVLNTPEVKAELGLPADVEVVAPIIVGYPSGSPPHGHRKPPQISAWR